MNSYQLTYYTLDGQKHEIEVKALSGDMAEEIIKSEIEVKYFLPTKLVSDRQPKSYHPTKNDFKFIKLKNK